MRKSQLAERTMWLHNVTWCFGLIGFLTVVGTRWSEKNPERSCCGLSATCRSFSGNEARSYYCVNLLCSVLLITFCYDVKLLLSTNHVHNTLLNIQNI